VLADYPGVEAAHWKREGRRLLEFKMDLKCDNIVAYKLYWSFEVTPNGGNSFTVTLNLP